MRSSASSNPTAPPPGSDTRPAAAIAAASASASSGSTVSGACPARPSITALSVPCPRPVQASEPNSVTETRAARPSSPDSARPETNAPAAFIGPTVCEEEGPMPILKRSRVPIITRT